MIRILLILMMALCLVAPVRAQSGFDPFGEASICLLYTSPSPRDS